MKGVLRPTAGETSCADGKLSAGNTEGAYEMQIPQNQGVCFPGNYI